MVVRVDDPRHHGEPRAVDDLAAARPVADGRDPAALDRDVGAAEIAPAEVDEAVPQDDVRHQWWIRSTSSSPASNASTVRSISSGVTVSGGVTLIVFGTNPVR